MVWSISTLSVCPTLPLSVCLSVFLCLTFSISGHPSIHPSFSVSLSVYLSVLLVNTCTDCFSPSWVYEPDSFPPFLTSMINLHPNCTTSRLTWDRVQEVLLSMAFVETAQHSWCNDCTGNLGKKWSDRITPNEVYSQTVRKPFRKRTLLKWASVSTNLSQV